MNRYLAALGLGSRRSCDELIASGRILVDGKRVSDPAHKVVPGVNRISLGGKRLDHPLKRVVLLMNKPEGVVTTASDPMGRKTVMDICRRHGFKMRLFPVGRLDINTTGAILLTNDGVLCYRLTHPRFHVPKTYSVRVRGRVTDQKIASMKRAGSNGSGGNEAKKGPRVDVVKTLGKEAVLRVVLYEGRNRQVRRMCEAVGLRVVKLRRVSIGPISIRKLPKGTVRALTTKEMTLLEKAVGEEEN